MALADLTVERYATLTFLTRHFKVCESFFLQSPERKLRSLDHDVFHVFPQFHQGPQALDYFKY